MRRPFRVCLRTAREALRRSLGFHRRQCGPAIMDQVFKTMSRDVQGSGIKGVFLLG